jgi:formylglycine-generating enzyme required for sulfatase activity
VATDIYSLGAICYTMLTGKQPPRAASAKHWPSSEQLRQELRGLPPGLVKVLEKCLQQDPGRRFRSVSALQEAASAVQNAHASESSRVNLDSLRKNSPADPDMCVRVLFKIIARLREIHAANQSHAELSPQKIWLLGDTVEIDSAPPVAGQGTLLIPDAKYSAPELLMAQTAPDEASHTAADIYVLGLTLYELLAGNTKMEEQFSDFAQFRSGLGWMRWHVEPEQKLQPLIKLLPDCPDALSDLLERMLEKNAAKRIRSLDEIETKLKELRARMEQTDQFVAGPVAPEAVSAKKKPARLGALALLTVLILAGIAGGGWWLDKGASFRGVLIKWQSWHVKKAGSHALGVPAAVRPALSGPLPVARTSTGIMLLIPQGEFVMGDDALPNAAPAHKVSLPAYYLDRVEISNLEYRRFCQKTGRALPPKPAWDPGYFGKDEYPVINVTWQDAKAFCESYNQRLPSESEWEKAARGTESFIHWANWTLPGLANIRGVAGRRPAPVGSFPADVSPYGVLDLAGNVQEWVNDSYRPYGKVSDTASGAEDGRKLVRGGSYVMDPDGLSPASRGWVAEGSGPAQSSSVGFRCAADPAQIAVKQP